MKYGLREKFFILYVYVIWCIGLDIWIVFYKNYVMLIVKICWVLFSLFEVFYKNNVMLIVKIWWVLFSLFEVLIFISWSICFKFVVIFVFNVIVC